MADVGLAIQRAKDKTEQMQARAAAVDELVEAGTLEDFTSPATARSTVSWRRSRPRAQVDAELAKIKAELGAGGEQKAIEEGKSTDRPAHGRRAVPGRRRLLASSSNELDDQALAALERDDEEELDRCLDEMWRARARARHTSSPTRRSPPPTSSSRRAT